MSTLRKWMACGVFCFPLILHGQTPNHATVTAVRGKRMLDVRTGDYILNPVVLIQNGRITAVGSGLAVPAARRHRRAAARRVGHEGRKQMKP